jgi:hypothetical protein
MISPGCTGDGRNPSETPLQTVNRTEMKVGPSATPLSANLMER